MIIQGECKEVMVRMDDDTADAIRELTKAVKELKE